MEDCRQHTSCSRSGIPLDEKRFQRNTKHCGQGHNTTCPHSMQNVKAALHISDAPVLKTLPDFMKIKKYGIDKINNLFLDFRTDLESRELKIFNQ
jgi:hypothetical protein